MAALATLIAMFARKGIAEKDNKPAALNESSSAFAGRAAVEKSPAPEASAAPGRTSVVTKLEGRFSPNDESLLIEQLTRQGYTDFSSYRLDDDGSAVITAVSRQTTIQPLLTIAVDKHGDAIRIE